MSNCIPCKPANTDPRFSTGNCAIDDPGSGNGNQPEQGGLPCVVRPNGRLCPDTTLCSPWDLTKADEITCLTEDFIEEQLNISGANVNVHKLLGVHEQGILQDLTNNGLAISSGDLANNPAINAFDEFITEWRSSHTGSNVTANAFIGYDFGPFKLANGRDRYGVDTFINRDISTIRIMQGCESKNRATKIRVERSSDGVKWYGVAVLNVQDCDGLVTLNFRRTVPSRWWRIRPVEFNGGNSDYWAVRELQFIEYEATSINNIEDPIFLENRNRDYDEFAITLKAQYTPSDRQTVVSRFAVDMGLDDYSFDFSFRQIVSRLGRPFVIGDIIELPSETQYSASLRPIKKYLEVTDVSWSANGFGPNWVPTIQKISAKPVMASQETQDIFGKLTADVDSSGLFDINDGLDGKAYQDYHDISQTLKADALTQVPAKGIDLGDIAKLSDELLAYSDAHPNMNLRKNDRPKSIFGIDALPPNGLPYTEGDDFPAKPKDGDYHRLTYTRIGSTIPARLHRYSDAKKRWIYLQKDMKQAVNSSKQPTDSYLNESSSKTPIDKIKDEFSK